VKINDFKKKIKIGTAFGINKLSIYSEPAKKEVMTKSSNKMAVYFVIGVGSLIGMVRGEQAKQKWVFKIRSKYDNKRLIAEKRELARNGGVLLDDIEMASFHNN
jgi:hypothetical protein